MTHFGKKLHEIMIANGTYKAKVAEATGISKGSIGDYVNPEEAVFPSYDKIVAIARHFKISEHYFFSNILPERFYQMEKAKAVWPQMGLLDDNEQKVILEMITAFASKKLVLQNESPDLSPHLV
jgi:transcriptional regulator with XRE-family HTH domain